MEKYLCIKEVIMEISLIRAFTWGQEYDRIKPEVWPPDRSIKHCLKDNMGSEHFFSPKEFNRHFKRVGVVENFAHEPTKEPHTEALNKHIVMESVCRHCGGSPIDKVNGQKHCPYCDKWS